MKLVKAIPLLLALISPIFPSIASATTIDFESTGTPNSWNYLDYPIDGYVFNATMDNIDSSFWGMPTAGHGGSFAALNHFGGIGELSRLDGKIFSLSHLNFINWFGNTIGTTFVVTGFKAGNEVGSVTMTGSDQWQSISTNFSAVDKVTFKLLYQGDPNAFLIDDIVVNSVPEPESYAMLLAGLGLLGFMVRRRKDNG